MRISLFGLEVRTLTHSCMVSAQYRARESTSDIQAWDLALVFDNFRIGVCRGAQFANVMNGGSLWQDVDGHTKDHSLVDNITGEVIKVSSTHHQMMIPSPAGEIVATADESTRKTGDGTSWRRVGMAGACDDPEVIYYPKARTLCFQPHPEYLNYEDTTDYFFNLIERYY